MARGRPQRPAPPPPAVDATPGLPARRVALDAVAQVLSGGGGLDDVLDRILSPANLPPRDAALARAIAVTTFRHFGTLRRALAARLRDGLPETQPHLVALLATGGAQVLILDVPDHAAVDLAVRLAHADPQLAHAAGLANAILRRLAREKETILREADPLEGNTPEWLAERWVRAYGRDHAARIAAAHGRGAALDVTVPADAAAWAEQLGGRLLPTGSVRLDERGLAVPELPGFADGAWWVQDAAAALPARLLDPRPGLRVADLCAAPGGKTAQLAAAGAEVVAVDRSAVRLQRLAENLARLKLAATSVASDVLALPEDRSFDAVLLDAPCAATGTLRRHPDVAWIKGPADVARLAALQGRLLAKAARLVRPGGRLVYCTCSLEPEEGEAQAAAFLAAQPGFVAAPVGADEVGGLAECVTPEGWLRTLPSHLPAKDEPAGERGGIDGFFAARFERRT